MVFSVAEIVRWRCEMGCCATETSGHVVAQVGSMVNEIEDGVLHDLRVGSEGAVFIGRAGGGSAGLAGGSAVKGGAWGLTTRGGKRTHSCFGSSSHVVVVAPLRMDEARSVLLLVGMLGRFLLALLSVGLALRVQVVSTMPVALSKLLLLLSLKVLALRSRSLAEKVQAVVMRLAVLSESL